jgi:hypothetical protein
MPLRYGLGQAKIAPSTMHWPASANLAEVHDRSAPSLTTSMQSPSPAHDPAILPVCSSPPKAARAQKNMQKRHP